MDYPRPIDPREPRQQQQAQWQAPQQAQWQASQQQWPPQQSPLPGMMMALELQKNWTTTAFLCYFLGGLGIHRFYTGRVVSGIFQLLTFGGFGIWTLIDLIMIYTDSFTDDRGMPLTRMEGVQLNVYMRNPQVKD